jgi:hypothetical protein
MRSNRPSLVAAGWLREAGSADSATNSELAASAAEPKIRGDAESTKKRARFITKSIVANIVYFSQKGKENGSWVDQELSVAADTCERNDDGLLFGKKWDESSC